MQPLLRGRYQLRIAQSEQDLQAAQALRWRGFVGNRALAGAGVLSETATGAVAAMQGLDADRFDALCRHALIEDRTANRLVGCFRMLLLPSGAAIPQSYSAQYYDLSALAAYAQPMLELGRFCMASDCHDPDVLRLAWGGLSSIVDSENVGFLFGCSSFLGARWEDHAEAFAVLAAGHIAPDGWRPGEAAPQVIRYAQHFAGGARPDAQRGLARMPPLLRSYLSMGGWVSDHAVVDTALDTLHVFTGLEIAKIPPARARALRLVAQEALVARQAGLPGA